MVFSAPIKGRAQCYASLHSRIPVKTWCRLSVPYRGLYYTNYQYITNTCACVESPHDLLFVSICSKSSTIRPRYLYITFYLCCKCATFLSARIPSNATERKALKSSLYSRRENFYEYSSALTITRTLLHNVPSYI